MSLTSDNMYAKNLCSFVRVCVQTNRPQWCKSASLNVPVKAIRPMGGRKAHARTLAAPDTHAGRSDRAAERARVRRTMPRGGPLYVPAVRLSCHRSARALTLTHGTCMAAHPQHIERNPRGACEGCSVEAHPCVTQCADTESGKAKGIHFHLTGQ